MHRVVTYLWLAPVSSALILACNNASPDGNQDSASATDGTGQTGGGITVGVSDSAEDTGGHVTGGADSAGTDSAGTDSAGTGSAGTGSAGTDSAGTDSAGTDSAGTDSASTDSAGTDSAGTDSAGTGGPGPDDPPPETPPGVDSGFCNTPGEYRWCFSGSPQTYNVGECQPGVQQCQQIDLDLGQWGPCVGEAAPSQEICDGLDNDCNGDTDENLGSTTCGMGICHHTEPNCVDGEPNECDPHAGEQTETCNDLDDDCDGQIDDGLGDQVVQCGVGQCEHTVTGCVDGMTPECDPIEGASNEVCDGIDNDCDGDTDEDIPELSCGVGQCAHTQPACIGGIEQTCDPYDGQTTEVCDGVDNDCDGLTDEDLGNWVCGNLDCQVTVPTCIDGVPQGAETCVPEPGGAEVCGDGIDNNCDGEAPACVETFLVGTDNQARPVDIIWAIDSSGSMVEEMATVEAEINDFATTLAASGSSTRLHLIADRGTQSFEICVNPPLGGVNCTDNPPTFYQYDTNGGTNGSPMVHSSNALGRIMQQSPVWIPRLQANSHIAFIVTSDDDGDSPNWAAPEDPEGTDDCNAVSYIYDGTTNNYCLWDDPTSTNNYTSLAYDWDPYLGFASYVANFFPNFTIADDWTFYSIIGGTGTAVLTGADDAYEFECDTRVEDADEYVKLSLLTSTQDTMTAICAADWDLSGLAQNIANNIPNDTYVLTGSPSGNCLNIDASTLMVLVNGIPMANGDWSWDAASCTLTINNNIPVVGDNVVIVYENV